MNTKYCHHCGAMQLVSNARFCSSCGTSLASLSATPAPPPEKARDLPPPVWANPPDDDDTYLDRINHLDIRINKLDFDIKGSSNAQVEKIGDVAGTQATVNRSEFREGINLTPEQVKEQFAKEAGSRVAGQKTRQIEIDEK